MTFSTFETGNSDLVWLDFAPAAAMQVLAGWQSWLSAADRNSWAMVDLSVGSTQANCRVLATCPAGAGPGVVTSLKSAIGLAPKTTQNKTLSHADLMEYLAEGSPSSSPRAFVAGSDVIGTLNSSAAHAIATAIGQWPTSGAGQASVIAKPLGGAVGDVADFAQGLDQIFAGVAVVFDNQQAHEHSRPCPASIRHRFGAAIPAGFFSSLEMGSLEPIRIPFLSPAAANFAPAVRTEVSHPEKDGDGPKPVPLRLTTGGGDDCR